MDRLRVVLGLLGGAIVAASSAAHSLLGWPVMARGLAAVNAPADLVSGLRVGWHFAGLAILVFGLVALALFAQRFRGLAVTLLPVTIIAVAYTAFGVWALLANERNPFFLIFIVPGIMLLVASWEPRPPVARVADSVPPNAALR